jgi:hypothetical protein
MMMPMARKFGQAGSRRGISRRRENKKIRAADAKEVGMGNPAEETCCYPNDSMLQFSYDLSTGNLLFPTDFSLTKHRHPDISAGRPGFSPSLTRNA